MRRSLSAMPRCSCDHRSRMTASTAKAPLLGQRIPVTAFGRDAGVLGIAPPTPKSNVSMRPQPTQPSKTMQTPITATHGRLVQYSQNHAYRQEAPTRLPHSFLAEGPRASRALSASRASSSPNSTGSSPVWPSPCHGRPSGRRGRTRYATIRACGLWPARRWASSACSCAGATWPLCRDAWWPGRCSRRAPCAPSSTGSPGPPCPCALGSL